uniref:Uncharacterized protein n=1 Tax=Siphoviridae sp. ctTnV63 TaxID=2825523 RepID=A0A8S5NV72_9CAUD|nr:MAG TPA: hypothetical protein [Siphoviridae sp. ctTnV63]
MRFISQVLYLLDTGAAVPVSSPIIRWDSVALALIYRK